MKLSYIIIVLFLILSQLSSYTQTLDGTFIKQNCEVEIFERRSDTIFATRNPYCDFAEINDTINGTWLIYSNKDSITLIEEFQIVNKRLEGVRSSISLGREKYSVSYKNGVYHGPYLIMTSSNRVLQLVNFINGEKEGDYYYYMYDENEKLLCISRYKNRKWLGKKIIKYWQ